MFEDGNKINKIIIAIIISFSLFSSLSLADSNKIIYVDDNGEGDYNLIQDAIDNANDGDTIHIYNGTYYENIIISKSIILKGEDKTNTFIKGDNNVILINSDNVFVEDLTITKGLIGINIINSSKCTILKNTIINNDIGININNLSDNNIIYNNNFFNNSNNAIDYGDNRWYNQKSQEGNYWDDFDESHEGSYDNNSDGIVDYPYNLSIGLNQDLYPIFNAFTIKPISNFTFSPNKIFSYDLVKFNDTSYDPDGYITSWFWDFGDGNISYSRNATNIYENDGIFNVTLEITDNYGVNNKSIKKLNISNSKPIVRFYYNPIQPNDLDNIIFYDESYDKDGGIVRWEWDFGDGTILLNPNNPREIVHKYEDNGTYNVTLKVYDNDNVVNFTSIEINVLNVKPSANFYYKPTNITENLLIIENEEVKFYDTSTDEDGEIVKYNWDFGDNSISNLTSPSHIFKKGGPYDIKLTVYDNDNESDTKQVRITVLSKYEINNSNTSFPTGLSILAVIIIIFILVMVGIAIVKGRKS